MVKEDLIPEEVSCVQLNIKDGLDGAGNQIHIKEKLNKMVTMAYTILEAVDTSDPVSIISFMPLIKKITA